MLTYSLNFVCVCVSVSDCSSFGFLDDLSLPDCLLIEPSS